MSYSKEYQREWRRKRKAAAGSCRINPPLVRAEQMICPEPNTGCWLWTGVLNQGGYGHIGTSRGREKAHRFMYEALVGPIQEGMCALHRCDTPACVNPAHIFLGTYADNNRDMAVKGRSSSLKISDDAVRRIRAGVGGRHGWQAALARELGVSISTIGLIAKGKNRRHVPEAA